MNTKHLNEMTAEELEYQAYLLNPNHPDLFELSEGEKKLKLKKAQVVKDMLRFYESNDDVEPKNINLILLDVYCPEYTEAVKAFAKYADDTPYKIYPIQGEDFNYIRGRNGQKGSSLVERVLSATNEDEMRGIYCDLCNSYEESVFDYEDFSELAKNYWSEVINELDFVCHSDKVDEDILRHVLSYNDIYIHYDVTEAVNINISNTKAHVRAIPILADGTRLYNPHFDNGEEENEKLTAELVKLFGFCLDDDGFPEHLECPYAASKMTFYGTLDLLEILTETLKVPDTLVIHEYDENYIFHTHWNGSGSLREPKIHHHTITMRCEFLDDESRYGVDAVYGYSESQWTDNPHMAITKDWSAFPDVDAFVQKERDGEEVAVSVV